MAAMASSASFARDAASCSGGPPQAERQQEKQQRHYRGGGHDKLAERQRAGAELHDGLRKQRGRIDHRGRIGDSAVAHKTKR
jgi:signal transduction histidine kinase